MRSILPTIGFLVFVSAAAWAEAPKNVDYNRAHAEEQFAAALANPKFAGKHLVRVASLSGDPKKGEWHEIETWEGYSLSYRRGSGATVEIRATMPGTKAAHNKLVAVVRYTVQVPAAAYSKEDRAYAAAHWRSFRDAGGLNYVEPAADYCTGYLTADRDKGIVSATAVAWGPAWKLDEKQFEIELALLGN